MERAAGLRGGGMSGKEGRRRNPNSSHAPSVDMGACAKVRVCAKPVSGASTQSTRSRNTSTDQARRGGTGKAYGMCTYKERRLMSVCAGINHVRCAEYGAAASHKL